MIVHASTHGGARFAFTGRAGGASQPPFHDLNLARHVGDEPAAVEKNRGLLAEEIGLPSDRVVYMNQVHGADVAFVDGPWADADAPPSVDAMVTSQRGLALAVLVADCVPILLADPRAGVIGVAHAGRPGMAAGVVPAVVAAMREAGADDIAAQIGPAVCGGCYEVPADMRADVAAVVPESWATTRAGMPALDVPAGVQAQLRAAGVRSQPSGWAAPCTIEDPAFFSYRRERTTGRFAGLVWLEP